MDARCEQNGTAMEAKAEVEPKDDLNEAVLEPPRTAAASLARVGIIKAARRGTSSPSGTHTPGPREGQVATSQPSTSSVCIRSSAALWLSGRQEHDSTELSGEGSGSLPGKAHTHSVTSMLAARTRPEAEGAVISERSTSSSTDGLIVIAPPCVTSCMAKGKGEGHQFFPRPTVQSGPQARRHYFDAEDAEHELETERHPMSTGGSSPWLRSEHDTDGGSSSASSQPTLPRPLRISQLRAKEASAFCYAGLDLQRHRGFFEHEARRFATQLAGSLQVQLPVPSAQGLVEVGGFAWPPALHMTTFYGHSALGRGGVPEEALAMQGSTWQVFVESLVYAADAVLLATLRVGEGAFGPLPMESDALPHVTLLTRWPFRPRHARDLLASVSTARLLGYTAGRSDDGKIMVCPGFEFGGHVADVYILNIGACCPPLPGLLQSFHAGNGDSH